MIPIPTRTPQQELTLTKPPTNTTCPLSNQILLPSQLFFKQNEGGYVFVASQSRKELVVAHHTHPRPYAHLRFFSLKSFLLVLLLHRFIKLQITNPLNTRIDGPIIVRLNMPATTSTSLAPPNANINYATEGGLFLYPPGTTVDGIDNKYVRSAKPSRGAPPPVISENLRTANWTISSLARKCIPGLEAGMTDRRPHLAYAFLSLAQPPIHVFTTNQCFAPKQRGRSSS